MHRVMISFSCEYVDVSFHFSFRLLTLMVAIADMRWGMKKKKKKVGKV